MRRQIKEKTNILRSLILSLAICAGLTSGMTLIQEKEVSAAGYYNININGGKFDGNTYRCNGNIMKNCFFSDGTYTYYLDHNGHPMKDRLTYHPNGKEVIYFDKNGHEVFDNFAHVTKNISGNVVDDYCYFNTYGYMYVDRLTFDRTGAKLYYINPYGKMEHQGLFTFSNGAMGYAKPDGDLVRGQFMTVCGNYFYFHSSGYSAQGLITDGVWYYNYDMNSKFLGKFQRTRSGRASQLKEFYQQVGEYLISQYPTYEGYREDIDKELWQMVLAQEKKEGRTRLDHYNEHLYKVAKLRAKEAAENFDHISRNGYTDGYLHSEALACIMVTNDTNSPKIAAENGLQSWLNSVEHKAIVVGGHVNIGGIEQFGDATFESGVATYQKGRCIYFACVTGSPDDYIAEKYADKHAKEWPASKYKEKYEKYLKGFIGAYGERKVW